MVHVNLYGQFKNKKLVENISELLVENILPTNIRRPVNIDVWILNVLEEQAGGFCWGDRDLIDIEIARTSEGIKFTREEMLINLTHELIHAQQFISGELSPTTARWKKGDCVYFSWFDVPHGTANYGHHARPLLFISGETTSEFNKILHDENIKELVIQ